MLTAFSSRPSHPGCKLNLCSFTNLEVDSNSLKPLQKAVGSQGWSTWDFQKGRSKWMVENVGSTWFWMGEPLNTVGKTSTFRFWEPDPRPPHTHTHLPCPAALVPHVEGKLYGKAQRAHRTYWVKVRASILANWSCLHCLPHPWLTQDCWASQHCANRNYFKSIRSPLIILVPPGLSFTAVMWAWWARRWICRYRAMSFSLVKDFPEGLEMGLRGWGP